jgi:2-polyprenyl-3-methyl-5-hydroxy-6-metoxy-1,4-benzoquinol methylase
MKKIVTKATRLVRSGQRLVHEATIRLGLARYRAPFNEVTGDWDNGYAAGEHDHYGSLCERPRYAVLYGYLGARDRPVSILDIGCGVGVFRRGLPDELVDRFVGIDPASVAVLEARKQHWPRSEFHIGAVPDPGLGKFDVIVLNEVMYYSADVDDLLRRCDAVLNNNGWVLSSVTRHTGDFVLHRKLDEHFTPLDAVVMTSRTAYAKWRLALHAKRVTAAATVKTVFCAMCSALSGEPPTTLVVLGL